LPERGHDRFLVDGRFRFLGILAVEVDSLFIRTAVDEHGLAFLLFGPFPAVFLVLALVEAILPRVVDVPVRIRGRWILLLGLLSLEDPLHQAHPVGPAVHLFRTRVVAAVHAGFVLPAVLLQELLQLGRRRVAWLTPVHEGLIGQGVRLALGLGLLPLVEGLLGQLVRRHLRGLAVITRVQGEEQGQHPGEQDHQAPGNSQEQVPAFLRRIRPVLGYGGVGG